MNPGDIVRKHLKKMRLIYPCDLSVHKPQELQCSPRCAKLLKTFEQILLRSSLHDLDLNTIYFRAEELARIENHRALSELIKNYKRTMPKK